MCNSESRLLPPALPSHRQHTGDKSPSPPSHTQAVGSSRQRAVAGSSGQQLAVAGTSRQQQGAGTRQQAAHGSKQQAASSRQQQQAAGRCQTRTRNGLADVRHCLFGPPPDAKPEQEMEGAGCGPFNMGSGQMPNPNKKWTRRCSAMFVWTAARCQTRTRNGDVQFVVSFAC